MKIETESVPKMQCHIQTCIKQKLLKSLLSSNAIHHHQNPQELYQIWSCSKPTLQLGFGNGWRLVVCGSQETCPRNSFQMSRKKFKLLWGKRLWEQPEKFQSDKFQKPVQHRRHCTGRVLDNKRGETANRNKILILSSSLCRVSFQYLVWKQTYKHGRIIFLTTSNLCTFSRNCRGGGAGELKQKWLVLLQGGQGGL